MKISLKEKEEKQVFMQMRIKIKFRNLKILMMKIYENLDEDLDEDGLREKAIRDIEDELDSSEEESDEQESEEEDEVMIDFAQSKKLSAKSKLSK